MPRPVKKHRRELLLHLLHFTFVLIVCKFYIDYKLINLNNDDTFLALNPKSFGHHSPIVKRRIEFFSKERERERENRVFH